MRKLAFILLILCAPVMAREAVYELPNMKRAELYARVVDVFNTEPDLKITHNDKAGFAVDAIGGWFMKDGLAKYPMIFSITVKVVDNKVRIVYDDVRIMPLSGPSDITSRYPKSDIDDRLAEYDRKILDAIKQSSSVKK